MKKVIVIGAGFSGLSTATQLASLGYEVEILEKNEQAGGRARVFSSDGFVFDMGPSWYWMPDIFEMYFAKFGKKPSDYYELVRLDPSYSVILNEQEVLDLPANFEALKSMFESIEKGSSQKLDEFLQQAAYKYQVGIGKFVWKPSLKIAEFLSLKLLVDAIQIDVFQSFYTHIRKFFKSEKLLKLMEFPILFLGAISQNTPALYSLMNYAEIKLGTWYPMGGMHKIVEGMLQLAQEKGVKVSYHQEVLGFEYQNGSISSVRTNKGIYAADAVIASADYHHVEQLLENKFKNYSEAYWDKRIMAPSSLLFYVGFNKKIENISHHALFFDTDFNQHAKDIYDTPKWPVEPLFYANFPSVTDPTAAPEGMESAFFLIPLAPGIEDTEALREEYFHKIMDRFELLTQQEVRKNIIFKQSFCKNDFEQDYNSYKGNAYGMANTLLQTAFLRPKLKSKKVNNLFFTGQLTVPGPGVPPALISGKLVSELINKQFSKA